MWCSTVHAHDRITLSKGGVRRSCFADELAGTAWGSWVTVFVDGTAACLRADKIVGAGQKYQVQVDAPSSVKIEVDRCPR